MNQNTQVHNNNNIDTDKFTFLRSMDLAKVLLWKQVKGVSFQIVLCANKRFHHFGCTRVR